jgi:hypothetical protein
MKKFGLMAVVMVLAVAVQANEFRALSLPEMAAANGATHMARFTYADLTDTNVNTAQSFTNFAVGAKQGVELVCMVLEQAFDTGNTNYTGSCLLTVGDTDDADRFLTSTELASDGTEVFLKFARHEAQAPTLTITYTNVVVDDLTNVAVKGVTAAAVQPVLGQQLYTAAKSITATFTPNADEAVDANTAGAVRLYWRVFDASRLSY